jgi:hypothetical protein
MKALVSAVQSVQSATAVAGVIAFVLAWPRVQVHMTPVRLAVDVVAFTLGTISVCLVVWAALWWVGQRR